MNTALTWQTTSTALEDTLKLAERIGRKMRGGEVVELVSDLGGGKTSFVRGLAAGLGSHDTVRSPSFTLDNQYSAGPLTLHHFDFYRLNDPGLMRNELAEVIENHKAIVVIEWPHVVEEVMPKRRLTVNIRTTDHDRRELTFTYPKGLAYLIPKET